MQVDWVKIVYKVSNIYKWRDQQIIYIGSKLKLKTVNW